MGRVVGPEPKNQHPAVQRSVVRKTSADGLRAREEGRVVGLAGHRARVLLSGGRKEVRRLPRHLLIQQRRRRGARAPGRARHVARRARPSPSGVSAPVGAAARRNPTARSSRRRRRGVGAKGALAAVRRVRASARARAERRRREEARGEGHVGWLVRCLLLVGASSGSWRGFACLRKCVLKNQLCHSSGVCRAVFPLGGALL